MKYSLSFLCNLSFHPGGNSGNTARQVFLYVVWFTIFMGILRTILALSVVFAHCYGFVLVGGQNAVQLFYLISGFLISYVWVEKKAYANARSFYINRYLRLYPIYAVVAILSLCYHAYTALKWADTRFFDLYAQLPSSAALLLVFSNLTLFLQDWIMFLGVNGNQLRFMADFRESDIVLFHALLIHPAWTLGVELTFYLIAPFILRKRRIVILLLFISIMIRVYIVYIGLGMKDPWSYRFFPAELSLFLLGALAHQILLPHYKRLGILEKYKVISICTLVFITLTYWLIPVHELFKTVALFSFFIMLIPFVFQLNSAWDKWIGELSYPLYICHGFIIGVINAILAKVEVTNKPIMIFLVITSSIAFSIILINIIARPVDRLRKQFRQNS